MDKPPKFDDMKHFSKHGACVKLLALLITKLPHIAYGTTAGVGLLVLKHFI